LGLYVSFVLSVVSNLTFLEHYMKRLFALRNSRGQLVCGIDNKPVYFGSKPEARDYRSSISKEANQYFITLGVDHKLYKGV
jgi:hypothetical protein